MSSMLKRIGVGVVAAGCIIAPGAALSFDEADRAAARMAGSGTVYGIAGGERVKVNYGFSLSCDPEANRHRLHVSWGRGNTFTMNGLNYRTNWDTVWCEDTVLEQERADTPIDTHHGHASGRLRLSSGEQFPGYAYWTFTDGGARGAGADTIWLHIDSLPRHGYQVLAVDAEAGASGQVVRTGNHWAQRAPGARGP